MSKNKNKKKPSKAKQVIDKLKKGAKGIVQTAEDIPFVILLPFEAVMKNALDDKGISHTNHISDIAIKFAERIAGIKTEKKSGRFDGDGDGSHYNMYGPAAAYYVPQDEDFNLTEEVIQGLITGIIAYIKGLKKKKDSGQKLTPAEEKMLDNANKASEGALKAGKDYASLGIGDFLFSWKGAVALVVLIAILWIAFD